MGTPQQPPRVVIVGGGFAGLSAASALRHAPVQVTLIDRRNHHVFQPLLYQVATASLSPADIAAPIRRVLSRQRNAAVLLGEAVRIDAQRRVVHMKDGEVGYDYLVVATGATHSYFGHDQWAALAPGLKSIEDAIEIRRRFLLAFEAAEREEDAAARRARLTFVVVGGGPTGVELAGAMAEIARRSIPRDFRSIDTATARVILVEAEDRVLTAYPPDLSERARRDLEKLGVEVRLSARVTEIDERGVMIGSERVDAGCVFWAAGVAASPLARSLPCELDRQGRVMVDPDLSLGSKGHPEVFVVGDLAHVKEAGKEQLVPGVAPAAIQMGRFVARVVEREAAGGPRASRPAFAYHDKGMLATIGRARAIGTIFGRKVRGWIAWAMWSMIHVVMLIGFRNRLLVMIQWAWAYVLFSRGARLITGDSDLHLHDAKPDDRRP